MRRRLSAVLLVITVVFTGAACGPKAGSAASSASSVAAAASQAAGTGASTAATASADTTAACPTSNTKAFAKTRFVSDLGGAAFLIRRYLYQPYTAGTFQKGHSGRTVALIKAAATAATVVHLLKNASANAKANPTLCKAVAAPLASLTSTISGLTGSLTSGTASSGVLGGLGGAVTGLLGKASSGGVTVTPSPAS